MDENRTARGQQFAEKGYMVADTTDAPKTPQGRVRIEQEALEQQSTELRNLMSELRQRLEPVLLPANESKAEQTRQPEPTRSPIAYHASCIRGLVADACDDVSDLLRRLDV